MAIQNTHDFFVYDLSVLLCAEQATLPVASQLEQESTDPDAKRLFSDSTLNIPRQITRLQECFRLLGVQPLSVSCPVIDGFTREREQFMLQGPGEELEDLFNLVHSARIGRYKIGLYRDLMEGARDLGYSYCVDPLQETLREKEATVQRTEQLSGRITQEIVQRMAP